MSDVLSNLSNIAQWGTFALLGVVAVSQWQIGKKKVKTADMLAAEQTIDLVNERASALEKSLNDTKAQFKKYQDKKEAEFKKYQQEVTIVQQQTHDEVIRLQEQIKHKDGLIEQYTDILQNRDPELKDFMAKMTAFTAKVNDYLIENTRKTEGMLTGMDKIFDLNKTALTK